MNADHPFHQSLKNIDPELFAAIGREVDREEQGLELIASENYVSRAVLEAQGSKLTNKYAEGYPGKRYYGGCEFVDQAETLAIERAKKLFGCEAANVQPHSGSNANMAVYQAVLKPGDTVLGMNLSHGGHLTHGSPVNFSGKLYRAVHYGVRPDTQLIDYDQVRDLARQENPKMIIAGASAYPRLIDFTIFKSIADEVGACFLVDMAHIAGLVAAGLHPSPIPHADYTTTTTHKTLRGPRGGLILGQTDKMKSINSQIFPGIQGGPLMHVIAAKAVAFHEALQPSFKSYQQAVVKNAKVLAEALIGLGFGITTQGTDNHLMLIDLTRSLDGQVTGKDAESWLDLAGITVNKNTIPFETRSPFVTSGVRIGTPAMTTRGLDTDDMKQVARWIFQVIESKGKDSVLASVRAEVKTLCAKKPVYVAQ